jgi:hypothetical protein
VRHDLCSDAIGVNKGVVRSKIARGREYVCYVSNDKVTPRGYNSSRSTFFVSGVARIAKIAATAYAITSSPM